MQTAPAADATRDELPARRRADREEEEVEVAGAERLRGRLLDDIDVADGRPPAERHEANARHVL